MYPATRLEFIMAMLREVGNTNDLPEEGDEDLRYYLTADEKSGTILEVAPDLLTAEIVFNFGDVPTAPHKI